MQTILTLTQAKTELGKIGDCVRHLLVGVELI